jgi:8-oxo-dGTP pyrophosphatase MutT (NUDIX family)
MPGHVHSTSDIERLRTALGGRRDDATLLPLERPHAVVAAILREVGQATELLLIRRAQDERDPWSGHMALPGGHRSADDVDLLHTAVRETGEEVGLDLSRDAEFLGSLTPLQAMARGRRRDLLIVPLVFALHGSSATTPDAREVDEVIWAKVSVLASGAAETTFDYEHDGNHYALPAYDVDGRIVWGLTYRIVQDLLLVLGAERVAPTPGA